MTATEGIESAILLCSIFVLAAAVVAVIRHLIWKLKSDPKLRYPSPVATAMLAAVVIMPIFAILQALQDPPEMQNYRHIVPVALTPSQALEATSTLAPFLVSREFIEHTLALSECDLSMEVLMEAISPSTITSFHRDDDGKAMAQIELVLETTVRSERISHQLKQFEKPFFLCLEWEFCRSLLDPDNEAEEQAIGLWQLGRTLGWSPSTLGHSMSRVFHGEVEQELKAMRGETTDPEIRAGLTRLLTQLPN